MRKKIYFIAVFLLSFFEFSMIGSCQEIYGDTIVVDLTAAQNQEFLKSIQQKIFYLQNYISKISDKSIMLEDRLEMVESAVKLFSDENNIIQVSNAKTGKTIQLPVRQYFRRLAYINASMVEITFYKGIKLETIRKGIDGYFYGTALMFQETLIKKNIDGIKFYSDKTIKQVNFKSKHEIMKIGDETETVVEIFLENINVKEVISI